MYPVPASGCFSVCDRLAGIFLDTGKSTARSVQTWINKHPESTICGEVVRCQENEETQSVYLKNTYLIYNSEKVSIDNVKVYLQQKKHNTDKKDNHNKLLAGSLVLCPESWKR